MTCMNGFAADDYDDYLDNLDRVNDVLLNCLSVVPPRGDFDRPADTCRFDGIFAITEDGADNAGVIAAVVKCLNKKRVAADLIAKAQKCLAEDL